MVVWVVRSVAGQNGGLKSHLLRFYYETHEAMVVVILFICKGHIDIKTEKGGMPPL